MITKTTYYCEICGKAFTSKEECETHEFDERYSARKNDLQMYDRDWKRLDLNAPLDNLYAFCAETDEAFDFMEMRHKENGYDTPACDCGCTGAGHYFFNSMWYKLEDCEELLKKIRRNFENG